MNTSNLRDRLDGRLQSMQIEPSKGKMVNMPIQDSTLAPERSDFVALTNNAIDIINENLKSQQLSYALFDVIKSPSGGATAFTVPGLSGDEVEKELTGIILDFTTPRAYWETLEPVEGTPPKCFSRDSIISHDGKPCNRCAYNEFGSKDNGNGNGGDSNGKACKESVLLFFLRPDTIIPLIIRVPVSSKILFLRYMTRLVSSLTPVSGVVTRITLEKATNKTGQPYAIFNFEVASTLSSDEAANARAYGQKFVELLSAADAEPEMAEVG